MPWTQQQIDDAGKILTDAALLGPIEKVTLGEESYVVADEVTYTDEIYLEALEELKKKDSRKLDKKTDERETYNSAA
jgi:hypothetical protein